LTVFALGFFVRLPRTQNDKKGDGQDSKIQ